MDFESKELAPNGNDSVYRTGGYEESPSRSRHLLCREQDYLDSSFLATDDYSTEMPILVSLWKV